MSASEGKLATGTYMLRKLASAPLINSHSLGINLLTDRARGDEATNRNPLAILLASKDPHVRACVRARSSFTNPNAPRSPHIPCSPYH